MRVKRCAFGRRVSPATAVALAAPAIILAANQNPTAIQVAEAIVMAADTTQRAKPILRIFCARSLACLARSRRDTGPLIQRCGTQWSSMNESLSLPSILGSLDRKFISHLGSGCLEQLIASPPRPPSAPDQIGSCAAFRHSPKLAQPTKIPPS